MRLKPRFATKDVRPTRGDLSPQGCCGILDDTGVFWCAERDCLKHSNQPAPRPRTVKRKLSRREEIAQLGLPFPPVREYPPPT